MLDQVTITMMIRRDAERRAAEAERAAIVRAARKGAKGRPVARAARPVCQFECQAPC